LPLGKGACHADHSHTLRSHRSPARRRTPSRRRGARLHRGHPCDGERLEAAPLRLEFGSGRICLHGDGSGRIIAPAEGVRPSPFVLPLSPLCVMGAGRW